MKKYAIIAGCFLFFACEGERIGKGYIRDAQTNQPIDSAAYRDTNGGSFFYTDSTGYYYITGPFGGCTFGGCPDYTVEFSKPGYQTRTVGNPDGNIHLETE